MRKLIVINNPKDIELEVEGVELVSSRDYLTLPEYHQIKNARVFNLSNEYRYHSRGYYVSLLAEARGHKPIPTVKNLQDLRNPHLIKSISDELYDLIQKRLRRIKSPEFILSVYFGQNVSKQYKDLSHELHMLFQAPFMRVKFVNNQKEWSIRSIKPLAWREIPPSHLDTVRNSAKEYFQKKRYDTARPTQYLYDLAILVNPEETAPPSDKKALAKFAEIAEKAGCYVEFITKEDLPRLAEFDALFIRETTSVNHHTYRFARTAQSEGLAVIDDPDSILKCTNKVYLAELLGLARVPIPKTGIVHGQNKQEILKELGLPIVIKLPDSSFSIGVVKAKTEEEYYTAVNEMLEESDLVLAQEYMPTDFDWRIGVLDGKLLFACKYYMAKGHWQIYNWASKDTDDLSGNFETFPPEQVPAYIVQTALKATQLIGNGLYGVDLKEVDGKAYVIEINDNPNLDAGIEDQFLGDELYQRVIQSLIDRIEQPYAK